MMNKNIDRYNRQILLTELGEEGQTHLGNSKAVLIGCGALGSTCATLLVRMGIGSLIIADGDNVEIENLHRQILFDEDDVKRNITKSVIAVEKLERVNKKVNLKAFPNYINNRNIETLIKNADIIFDGTDNFETRLLINDVSLKHNIPWVYGGVVGTSGMIMPIVPNKTPCLRCLYPITPIEKDIPTTKIAGVFPPIPMTIAASEVTEGIKILTKNLDNIISGLLIFDQWHSAFPVIQKIQKRTDCPACSQHNFEFLN